MRATAILLFTLAALPQIEPPSAGIVRDRTGALRRVHGVAGAFVLGEPIETGVISAGFSGAAGFAKTETEILVFDRGILTRRVPAPPGPAEFLFAPEPGAYLPATGELWSARTLRLEKFARPHPEFAADNDEVILPGGERLRLPEPVEALEWMSEHWAVARGASALYAVRVTGAERTVVRLPEAAQ